MTPETARSQLELPFDRYQRYALAARVIDAWRADGPLHLLEIGPGEPGDLERFAPGDRISMVEAAPRAGGDGRGASQGRVIGDPSSLPVRADSVDVAVALDVLGSVPPRRREAFLDQLVRVARRGVVLAAPFASTEITREEERLRSYARNLDGDGGEPGWPHPLPDLESTLARLESSGWHVRGWAHGNLRIWAKLRQAQLHGREEPLRHLRREVEAFYNEELFEQDWGPPVYRHLIAAAPSPDDLEMLGACFDMGRRIEAPAMLQLQQRLGRLYEQGDRLRSERTRRAGPRETVTTATTARPTPAPSRLPSPGPARAPAEPGLRARIDDLRASIEQLEGSLADLDHQVRAGRGAQEARLQELRDSLERMEEAARGRVVDPAPREATDRIWKELSARSARSEEVARQIQAIEAANFRQESVLSEFRGRLDQIGGQLAYLIHDARTPWWRRWLDRITPRLWWRRVLGHRLHRLRLEPVHQIEPHGVDEHSWRSTGGDPHFHLATSRSAPPSGWTSLRYRAGSIDGRLEPVLYFDVGAGFNEQHRLSLPPVHDGEVRTIVKLPEDVRGLRLDPMYCPGRFRLEGVSARELGLVPLYASLWWSLLRGLGFHPGPTLEKLRTGFRTLRWNGLGTFKHWLLQEGLAAMHGAVTDYARWTRTHDDLSNADRSSIREHLRQLESRPLVSVVIVGARASAGAWRRTIDSVRGQIYGEWEIVVAGDAPGGKAALEHLRTERVEVRTAREPGGELVARIDAGDEIAPHALYMVVVELNRNPETDVVYTDEDRVDGEGRRHDPDCKPDWNPELLLTRNFVRHLLVFRRSLVERLDAPEWSIALGLASQVDPNRIRHLPHILYHDHVARGIDGGTAEPDDVPAQELVVAAARGAGAADGPAPEVVPIGDGKTWRVRHPIPRPAPLVSILVCSRDRPDLLERCLRSIRERTSYPEWEVVVVDHESRSPEARRLFEALEPDTRVRVIRHERSFQHSAMNNRAAGEARGRVLVLLNDDTEVQSPGWLEELVGHALREEVGAVGARLLRPDGTIQHAGVILGLGESGVAGHALDGRPADDPGPRGRARHAMNVSAVTGACLAIRKDLFEGVGGLDERSFPNDFGDVDLCLRLGEAGRRVVWTPHATLVHHGGATRGDDHHRRRPAAYQKACERMRLRWLDVLGADPAYNPNLDLEKESYALASPPRTERPWVVASFLEGEAATGPRPDPYDQWKIVNQWNGRREGLLRDRLAGTADLPRIAVVMPVFDPRPEFLDKAIRSVVEQVYTNWELCIADDASRDPEVKRLLRRWAEKDERIRVRHRERNGNISAATNSAAALAEAPFLAFLDHDDLLSPDALAEVALHLAEHPDTEILYSDDDKVDPNGWRYGPQFKPGPSPELLLAFQYFSHLVVMRRDLFVELGGARLGFEGAQDYDLLLRATDRPRHIAHIPRVLYHWRSAPGSTAVSGDTKPASIDAGRRAVQEALDRRGIPAETRQPEWAAKARCGIYAHRFPDTGPSVAILIPTRNRVELLRKCLESIEKTTYGNFEVIVIDNESDDPETLAYLREIPHRVIRIASPGSGFSFAALNNEAVRRIEAEYVLFLNNDTEVRAPTWLSEMVGYLGIEGVGAVGARLLFPDGKVQHAGIVHGYYHGAVGPAFKLLPEEEHGSLSLARVVRNCLAATAACLLTPRKLFLDLGGFDEERFAVAYNDVDYGIRLHDAGHRTVFAPGAELIHHEGRSRGFHDRPSELAEYKEAHGRRPDPYYNPHLSLDHERFEIDARTIAPAEMPPIRTLAVSHSLRLAGAPWIQHELVVGLKERGVIDPVVFSHEDGPLRQEYEAEGIQVHVGSHPLAGVPSTRTYGRAVESFARRVEEWGAELVFANTIVGFYAVEAARAAGLPCIWNIHESEPWEKHFRDLGPEVPQRARGCFAHPYKVVFGSDATRALYAPLMARHNFASVHNGLDGERIEHAREEWPRADARKHLGLGAEEVALLILGTVCERKGQMDLVRALPHLEAAAAAKVRAFIVGDRPGEYSHRLHAARRRLEKSRGLRVDVVEETGEVGPYLAAADVFICTSRVECYPRVNQEAMAFGLPIVTTPVFGIREQVWEDRNALFYPPGDVRALARRLGRLVGDPDLRRRMGEASRDVLRTLTRFDENLDRYGRLLREAWLTTEAPRRRERGRRSGRRRRRGRRDS